MFVFTLQFCIYCFTSACRMCTARCLLFFCVCGTLGTTLTPLAPLPLPLLGCEFKSLTAGREATTRETGIEEKREGAVEEHGAKINCFIVPSTVFLASLHWRLPHNWSLPRSAGTPWLRGQSAVLPLRVWVLLSNWCADIVITYGITLFWGSRTSF